MRRRRAANPGRTVEVWAGDEARLGLKPITRRVWWPKGGRPTSCGRTKYEWRYAYGFARPRAGDTYTVRLHCLPPCPPELQPVEPFRVLVREAVANATFDRSADLRRRVVRRCRRLAEDRATVLGVVGFHWAVGRET